MIKKFGQYINESVRDKMTPKSSEDLIKALGNITPTEKIDKGCEYNIISLVEQGLKEGGSVPYRCMIMALANGNLDIVKMFYNDDTTNKSYSKNTDWSNTLFTKACESGNVELVRYLIEEQGIKGSITVNDVLHLIFTKKHYDVVKLLTRKNVTLRQRLQQKIDLLENQAQIIKDCI